MKPRSGHLRRLAALTHHVIRPALTAAGEVLAMGDQTLVQLAAQQGDALHPGVMTKPVAGHADLGTAGLSIMP